MKVAGGGHCQISWKPNWEYEKKLDLMHAWICGFVYLFISLKHLLNNLIS